SIQTMSQYPQGYPAPGQYNYPPQQGYPPAPAPGQYGYPPQQGYPPAPAPGQYNYPQQPYYPQPQAYAQTTGYPQQQVYPPTQQYVQPTGYAPAPYPQPGMPMMPPVAVAAPVGIAPMGVAVAAAPVAFAVFTPGSIGHDLKRDAENLRRAMKGLGTDERTLIEILGNRNWAERQAIIMEYSRHIGRDLIKDIKSETSFNFKKCLVDMLTDPCEYDADNLYKSMKGLGTNEHTLTEILVSRSNAQKARIFQIFNSEHNRSIKHWIESDTSGHYKHLLLNLLDPRDESNIVDPNLVMRDVDTLYYAGEGRLGTDEHAFIKIFAQRNFMHIREIARIYPTMHRRHTLQKAIDSEFSFEIRGGLQAIVSYALDSFSFFASILHVAMAGLGTNDDKLIRNIIYCQPFMPHVKRAYLANYGQSLSHAISHDCSGDYKKLLLEVVG
ncbi:hypothetical protein SAMD00019534_048640, partial [Acytostelium subglobosum LB1]|uniref:hypothetical protein n=1 Tax=Acytostelium subglobosum LB1 TaxID=1410327 RepID=UPI000644B2AA